MDNSLDPAADIIAGWNREQRRKRWRAMVRMAQSLGIPVDKYHGDRPSDVAQLWREISHAIGSGITVSPANSPQVAGDPVCVAVTAICQDEHEGQGWHRQTAIMKTNKWVDEFEAQKIIDYLKGQDPVRLCQGPLVGDRKCEKEITAFSVNQGKVSDMAIDDGYAMEWAHARQNPPAADR